MLVVFLVALSGVLSTYAQLSSHWNSNDFGSIQRRSAEIIRASQSSKDVYYSLQLLGYTDKEKRDEFCSCDNINKVASSSTNAFDIAYSLRANDICNCGFKPTQSQLNTISTSLNSDNLESVTGALYAGSFLKSLSDENIEQAVSNLRKLLTKDNDIVLVDLDNFASSLQSTRQVLDTLAELPRNNPTVSALVNDVYEKAFNLVPSGNHDVHTDVTILAGLSKLSESEKVKLSPSNLAESSDALASLRHSDDPYTLVHAYEASSLLSRNKKAPVYVDITNAKFQADQKSSHKLEFMAKNILGKDLKIDGMEVVFVKTVGKDQSYFQNENIEGNTLDLSSLGLSAGRYHVSVMIGIKNKPVRVPLQTYFIVTDTAEVMDVSAGITSSTSSSTSDLSTVMTQNSFSGDGNAAAGNVLHVNYQVSPKVEGTKIRKPHQSIVRLTEEVTGKSVYFVASKQGDSNNYEYTSMINLGDEVEKFGYTSGTWVITILVADSTYTTPVEYVVGSVDLKFPTKPNPTYPLYAKSLLHTSDNTLKSLPEIEHQMRPPAKQASSFMAMSFTGVVLVPLLVFLGYMVSLKPNLARFGSLSTVAFLVSFFALIALYLSYWFAIDGVTFYKTIQYLCMLFPVLVFVGSYALSSVMNTRLNEKKNHSKKSE